MDSFLVKTGKFIVQAQIPVANLEKKYIRSDTIDTGKSKQTPSEGRMEAELVRTRLTAVYGTGETIPVGEIVTIGRGSSNSIILNDDQVSRNHALIRQESGGYLIIDLGSSNGTFVNEKPATTATLLRANDVIRVGESEFVFRYVEEKGGGRGHATKRTTKRHFVAQANLAILVSDIRNYTILSEALPADYLSALLADWFRRVGRCVEARNGSIEKFRGDSVMAYWVPAADDDSGHIAGAIRAAGDMLTASAEYEKRVSTQYPGYTFAIGCAVHCGEAVLGNIGADSRRDFTTLGDCVNVTFRMESLCGELGRPVLVSEEIKAQAEPEFAFDDLGQRTLKGKSKPMRLYALRPPEP